MAANEESSAASNGPLGTSKDRDPPPAFDGTNPDALKQYLRDLTLWRWETDVPKLKHAVKVIRQLSGTARAAADELSVEQLQSEGGIELVIAKLKEHFQPHLEAAMPKAFEKAVYGEPRRAKESMQDYIIRVDKSFKELLDEGVKLGDDVKGYISYRQANLNSTQEDQVVTWTSGKYGREEVVRALRKLDKVHKERGGKSYLNEEPENLETVETYLGSEVENDHEIENYVYMNEGDMDQIFEEQSLHEALATYQQVRKAIRDQKTSRGWNKGIGKGSGKIAFGIGNNRGGLQFNQGSRVHIESLKLRTRCARCGVVGHWARECSSPPDEFARARAANSTASSKSAPASSMSGRSGFVHVTNSEQGGTDSLVTITKNFQVSTFCGIATHGAFGLVDTAAQSGLVGEGALSRLEKVLENFGLKINRTDRKAQARGVGGEAKVKEVVEIPLGLGGINGILEATVVAEDVPLLIPVKLLRELRAVIDFSVEQVSFKKHGTNTPMSILPSGHASISIVEFPPEGWNLPREAQVRGIKLEDFQISSGMRTSLFTAAMSENSNSNGSKFTDLPTHGGLAAPIGGPGGSRQWGEGDSQISKSECWMAMHHGKGAGADLSASRRGDSRGKKTHGNGAGLARHWIALWIAASCCIPTGGATIACLSRAFEQSGRAGEVANEWNSTSSQEVSNASKSTGMFVPASEEQFGIFGKSNISAKCGVRNATPGGRLPPRHFR